MLSDGEKIYVPNKEETSQESQEREYITSAKDNSEKSENGAKSTGTNFKININTAKQEELTQITGIGESTAKKIIEYRTQNGKFKSISWNGKHWEAYEKICCPMYNFASCRSSL